MNPFLKGIKMWWNKFLKHTRRTNDGMFFCEFCGEWIDKQRWVHFKSNHQSERPPFFEGGRSNNGL